MRVLVPGTRSAHRGYMLFGHRINHRTVLERTGLIGLERPVSKHTPRQPMFGVAAEDNTNWLLDVLGDIHDQAKEIIRALSAD